MSQRNISVLVLSTVLFTSWAGAQESFSTEIEGRAHCIDSVFEPESQSCGGQIESLRERAKADSMENCQSLLGAGAFFSTEVDLGLGDAIISKRGDEYLYKYQVTCHSGETELSDIVDQVAGVLDQVEVSFPNPLGGEARQFLVEIGQRVVPVLAEKYQARTPLGKRHFLSVFVLQEAHRDSAIREMVLSDYAETLPSPTDFDQVLRNLYHPVTNLTVDEQNTILEALEKGIQNSTFHRAVSTITRLLNVIKQNDGSHLEGPFKIRLEEVLREYAYEGPVGSEAEEGVFSLKLSLSSLWTLLGEDAIAALEQIMSDTDLTEERRLFAAFHLARWSDEFPRSLPLSSAVSLFEFNHAYIRYQAALRLWYLRDEISIELGDLRPAAIFGLLETIENNQESVENSTANPARMAGLVLTRLGGADLQANIPAIEALYYQTVAEETYYLSGYLALALAKTLKGQDSEVLSDLIESFEETSQIYFERGSSEPPKMNAHTSVLLSRSAQILKGEIEDYRADH